MTCAAVAVPRLGLLRLTASERGLCRIDFPGSRAAVASGAANAAARAVLAIATAELLAYAAGRLRTFTVAVDPGPLPVGIGHILTTLREIPYATTVSYGALAAQAGHPRGARLAGNAMARNPLPIIIPCHRVVATHGIGGYTPGLAWKRRLWDIEGLPWPQGTPCP
jgi:methylated-DNA-[protein]-cysteine S-methyltransferase